MAQPTTVVTPAYPYVEVEFAVGAFRSPIVLGCGDTGFDGYLIIPATQNIAYSSTRKFCAPWETGDRSVVVQAQEYRGDILVSGSRALSLLLLRPHYANRGRECLLWAVALFRPSAYDVRYHGERPLLEA